jgi:hypothetical protein
VSFQARIRCRVLDAREKVQVLDRLEVVDLRKFLLPGNVGVPISFFRTLRAADPFPKPPAEALTWPRDCHKIKALHRVKDI